MFKRILVPVEVWDPDAAARVLAGATTIARPAGASIVALTVLPDDEAIRRYKFSAPTFEDAAVIVQNELEALVRQHAPRDLTWTALTLRGSIYRKILEAAQEHQIELIVMAAHSRHLGDFLIGSNAERVARHSQCSVLLVRK